MIQAAGGSATLLNDLGDILKDLREMMKCEVLDEEMKVDAVIGLTHEELRAQSHNPMKYYNIKQMVLPDYTMGTEYAMLNKLRTSIRETEVAACQAFHDGKKYIRTDIIEELNRLSSALHIMMCVIWQAGTAKTEEMNERSDSSCCGRCPYGWICGN